MKVIAIEEHFLVPELMDAWPDSGTGGADSSEDSLMSRTMRVEQALLDHGERRIADMDDQGVDVQVLSLNSPGLQDLSIPDAVSVAEQTNDALAGIVGAHPDRFQGVRGPRDRSPRCCRCRARAHRHEVRLRRCAHQRPHR